MAKDKTAKPCKFCDRRKKKGLGPCGHHGGVGEGPAKATGGAAHRSVPHPAASRPAVPREVLGGDNGARATAKTLVGQLKALRAKLDERIATVEELADIL